MELERDTTILKYDPFFFRLKLTCTIAISVACNFFCRPANEAWRALECLVAQYASKYKICWYSEYSQFFFLLSVLCVSLFVSFAE